MGMKIILWIIGGIIFLIIIKFFYLELVLKCLNRASTKIDVLNAKLDVIFYLLDDKDIYQLIGEHSNQAILFYNTIREKFEKYAKTYRMSVTIKDSLRGKIINKKLMKDIYYSFYYHKKFSEIEYYVDLLLEFIYVERYFTKNNHDLVNRLSIYNKIVKKLTKILS